MAKEIHHTMTIQIPLSYIKAINIIIFCSLLYSTFFASMLKKIPMLEIKIFAFMICVLHGLIDGNAICVVIQWWITGETVDSSRQNLMRYFNCGQAQWVWRLGCNRLWNGWYCQPSQGIRNMLYTIHQMEQLSWYLGIIIFMKVRCTPKKAQWGYNFRAIAIKLEQIWHQLCSRLEHG